MDAQDVDSQFFYLLDVNTQSIKANQEGGLGLCSRMVARLDFKARASGAVDARGIKAKQNELVCILIHSFGLLGCERTGDQSQPGGGACMTVFAHGRSSASISRRVHRMYIETHEQ